MDYTKKTYSVKIGNQISESDANLSYDEMNKRVDWLIKMGLRPQRDFYIIIS